jgi:hypothetical protein
LQAGGQPSDWESRAVARLVSFLVSFVVARERSGCTFSGGGPWSQTLVTQGERGCADLESVLGETPQEFESPILRHVDLQKHGSWRPPGGRLVLAWSHLVVSVMSRKWCHRQDRPLLLCLVTGVVNGPERRGARRRSVRPTVQGRPGPSATWVQVAVGCGPDTRQLTDRITLRDREVLGERAPTRLVLGGCCHLDDPLLRLPDLAFMARQRASVNARREASAGRSFLGLSPASDSSDLSALW